MTDKNICTNKTKVAAYSYNGKPLPYGFTVTGHTGCMGTPDNSLEAIVAAAGSGVDIVEFDLRYDEKGEPVLSHDSPVGKVVTLDEAFATVKEMATIKANIDIKDTAYLEKVLPLAEKHGLNGIFFFTGVFEKDVPAVKAKCPDVPYYLNEKVRRLQSRRYLESLVKKTKDNGAVGINFKYTRATKKLVEVFRKNGLLVSVWTVNDEKAMKKILALSPDNITTRHPDKLLKILKKS
ncbi:MAG: glycerophosphodiester phosphodiesterase [Clostridia bacterium]|nr:glycerophosphodiester phosphodiesterase [Clostridia bacterium]